MKRAFGYVAADESVKSLYDNVKVLEFEQEVLGHKFNITLANATQASSAVADTTEYEAYLSSKGLTAEAISSVVSSLQNPPPMLLGITSDDKLVMARSTDALQAMVETKERPSDGELQTALLGVTAQAAAEGWKDPSGNFIAPAYRDRCLKAIINSLGGTITEENNRQFMGVTRISLCNAEVASWMTDETTGYNVRGLGWGIKELRVTSIQNYLDTSRITFGYSQDDRIPANGNYLANVSTNEANSNNITCSYQMAVSGITNHRTNVLNALTGSDLLLALEGAGFFNEGGDVEAAKTAIVDAGPTSSGLLLEFGTAAVGLITPLLHKDFCVCADLDGITKVQKGVGWEKLIPTTGKMYASIVNSDFAKMVDQEKYPEQYQALINEPGLVRAVYYLNPIEVAQDTVFSCAAYQHYKEGKDAAGEPDEFGATAVTSEGGLTFDDINAQLNRVTTVHMSVNPIVSTIETASHTPGTKEHALRYPEKYVGVINGVQDGGEIGRAHV